MIRVNQEKLLQGKGSAKYTNKDSYKEKTSKPIEKSQTFYYYKSPKTLNDQGMHNLLNSGTLELRIVLTWPSEGI